MATTQEKVNGNTETAEAKPKEAKSRFKKIETERYMYSPDEAKGIPLVGHLINIIPMPVIENRDWNAFVVKTTEPTIGMNRDKQAVDVPVDCEVLIPATFQLTQFFERLASMPKFVFEVSIAPKKKIKLPNTGGKTMWQYELGVNTDHPVSRMQFGPNALLMAPEQVKQVPTVAADVADKADDIPF